MSFQQGLSGLNGAAKSLDVIGNNIANASTVGFKGAQAQFADVYANSLNSAGGGVAGIGTKVAQIAQQFTQGNIETDADPEHMAINGPGFFRTSLNGAIQYTRNGQFNVDKEGYISNAQGARLTGYPANAAGVILPGAAVPLLVDRSDMKPVATTTASTAINLDSRAAVPAKSPFDPNVRDSFNTQTNMKVYDSLGNAHDMTSYYVKTSAGHWDVYVANDGTELANLAVAAAAQGTDAAHLAVTNARAAWKASSTAVPPNQAQIATDLQNYANAASAMVLAAATAAGASAAQLAAITSAATTSGTTAGNSPADVDRDIAAAVHVPPVRVGHLDFDTNGALSNALMAPQTMPLTVVLPIFPPTGAGLTQSVQFSFAGSTQYGSAMSEKRTVHDGYAAGQLLQSATGADGVVIGHYSNGETKALGQVVLANFANPNGLQPLGNNAWAETSASGGEMVGAPGGSSVLQSGAVESSNVDLTAELVNMITAQRVYQANAQTIKTQDSVLQTLVNLR
jgi:flagellar hook protein FlgE